MLALRPDRVMSVAVAPPARGEQRRQQDDAGAQVVLDRIREEDAAEEQSGERERVRDGVPRVVDVRLGEEFDGAADDGQHRQDCRECRDEQHRIEDRGPERLAGVGTAAEADHRRPCHSEAGDGQRQAGRRRPGGAEGRQRDNQQAARHQGGASGEAQSRSEASHQERRPSSPTGLSSVHLESVHRRSAWPMARRLTASLGRIVVCNWALWQRIISTTGSGL